MLSGCWQVKVDPKSCDKMAFTTYDGLFEFKMMPSSYLCKAPTIFQQLMDHLLDGLQQNNCLVYLDDVLIIGKMFKEHLSNWLSEAGLKLKQSKCDICESR